MPEEINPILTDHASDLLLRLESLPKTFSEGIAEKKIVRTGDIMLDAANFWKSGREVNDHQILL